MTDTRIREIVAYYIEHADAADLRTYGASFLEHFPRGLHSVRHMMTLGRMAGARVLDLGCGFGWRALMIALLGDNEVVANDVRELMTRNIEERLAAVREHFGIAPRLTTLCGDFIGAELAPGSFDAIFCNQTVEHVHDLDACFAGAREILRPGGVFVIANDNNVLTRSQLEEIEAMWIQRDSSWDFIRDLQAERPEENRDIKPYAVMREEIICACDESLQADELATLVAATAGQTKAEIQRSVQAYRATGAMPQRPAHSWCRNPITGEYCERQLDPFALKAQLQRHGFRVRLVQDLRRGGPLKLTTRWDIPFLNRLLFRKRARFVLAAEKRS